MYYHTNPINVGPRIFANMRNNKLSEINVMKSFDN